MNIEFEASGTRGGDAFHVVVIRNNKRYSVILETPGGIPHHQEGLSRHDALCLYTLHVCELNILRGVQFKTLPLPDLE